MSKGYLAVWTPDDGKLLYGEELPLGAFMAMSLSPDNSTLALGASAYGRTSAVINNGYLLKVPMSK